MEDNSTKLMYIAVGLLVSVLGGVNGFTDQNDFKILTDFRSGLSNPELLKWPDSGNDPCGPPAWPHVFCSNGRVTQIQVQSLGLEGSLPPNLNQLQHLENVGLQKNKFRGKLPTFSGLSSLQFAFLDFNEFDIIPADFFTGLTDIRVLALDSNPFNQSSGWSLPSELAESTQLVNFSCSGCNLVGRVPDFLGKLPSLASLRLSYNRLIGEIPYSFIDSMLQVLLLNDQDGVGMTGTIDVIGTMVGLTTVWLHGNRFSGPIPDAIGRLTSLRELDLNGNQLVGLIPSSLANMNLEVLDLSNNLLMGPIPDFKSDKVSYASNSFCQSVPGEQCAPQVSSLLDFLRGANYPVRLASQWRGNDPCIGPWWGITCSVRNQVSVINLQKLGLNGTLSPSLGNLSLLVEIHLEGNNLHGRVPESLARLRSLRLLNLSGNNFELPLPRFRDGVKVVTDGTANAPELSRSPAAEPPHLPPVGRSSPGSQSPNNGPSSSDDHQQSKTYPPSSDQSNSSSPRNEVISPLSDQSNSSSPLNEVTNTKNSTKSRVVVIAAAAGGSSVFTLLAVLFAVYCFKRRKDQTSPHSGVVVHPKDSSDSSGMVKIAIADRSTLDVRTGFSSVSRIATAGSENANLLFSLQFIRAVTNNFAQENELGRGGFGVVYKGELEDGTKVAVKRMVVAAINNKALDEFQSEIAVLSKVRHRHLVSLLGYSAEGEEKLLVYEYMPQGALSRHLFHWKRLGLMPLSWTRRLNIALDVARGLEYLHSLAHQKFIHRDLKPENILLDDKFRAKVSDFGLVKLAPDSERSVATRLAGTFGYLAPEYAVTGKITTKVDVFSFGVVLMELLTGLEALDVRRPQENQYLAEWFWQMKSKSSVIASIDPALDAKEDIYETIYSIAELAGHCTLRDPNHRPDMGHAVNVLVQMVEKWKPYGEMEHFLGFNMKVPLPQMVEGWEEEEGGGEDDSGMSRDSKGSIPAKPSWLADSFTSADAR